MTRIKVRLQAPHEGPGPHPATLLPLLVDPNAEVTVTFNYACGITRELFAAICRTPGLTALRAERVWQRTDWLEPLRGHPTVRSVTITQYPVGPDRCEILASLPNLEELNLTGVKVGDGFAGLTCLAPLRSLKASNADLTDASLAALGRGVAARGAALTEFALAGNPISDAGFTALPIAAGVTRLDLSDTHCGDGSLARLVGLWAPASARVENGQRFGLSIDLHGAAVTDAGLTHLTGVEEVDGLRLYDTAVTGAGFAAYAAAGRPLPLSIHLANSRFDDAGCATLVDAAARLAETARAAGEAPRTLRSLRLENTPVTDVGLARLATLPGLRFLGIGGDGITNASVAAIAGGTAAQVSVRGGAVTDAVFAEVANRRNLEWLILEDVPVGGLGLAALAARPAATHDGATPAVSRSVLVALFRREARERVLASPWGLARDAAPHLATGGAASPWRALLAAGLQVRRYVPAPPGVAAAPVQPLALNLHRVGLTDDTLRLLSVLPPLRIEKLVLTGDPITAEAVAAFVRSQPHLREVSVYKCPAADREGRAGIRAALRSR